MSYRTKVNDTQLFGNNDLYPEWIDFIKSQGIEMDDEFIYNGEIHDFMAMLEVVESIVLKMEKEKTTRRAEVIHEFTEKGLTQEQIKESLNREYGAKSLFDFTDVPEKLEGQNDDDMFRESLFDKLYHITEYGYAFMPYTLYSACKDKLERVDLFSTDGHVECFRIKDGQSIIVDAR